jgi:hypothetical protein
MPMCCLELTFINKKNHRKGVWTLMISETASNLISPHYYARKTTGRKHTSSEVRVLPPVFFCRCLRSNCNVKELVMDNSKNMSKIKKVLSTQKSSAMQWLWSFKMPIGTDEPHKHYAARTEGIDMYRVYWDISSQQINIDITRHLENKRTKMDLRSGGTITVYCIR